MRNMKHRNIQHNRQHCNIQHDRYLPDGDADAADEEAGRGLTLDAGGGTTGRCQSDAPGEEEDDGRYGRQNSLGPPRYI